MGIYDIFIDGENSAQLKCFSSELVVYEVGDKVPVNEFGFPDSCTFAEWGGNKNSPYRDVNILGKKEVMGKFVVIKDGQLLMVTCDLDKIIKPVYSKYGELLMRSDKK